ncbi:hypothetical protein [Amycolatopsis sp. NPDC051061]|uniref:hypothetical protein n=1 Tax=Amycolatopsis sp. NPDC051061 TaxID=3155042 RepID=UPI00341BA8EF
MSLVTEGQALILVGGPGTGKTARLNRAAADADGLVLRASGHRLETDVPFAGLHQLLRPVLDRADVLPARQRAALGVLTGDGGPDRLLLGIAVLNLLSELGPVVAVRRTLRRATSVARSTYPPTAASPSRPRPSSRQGARSSSSHRTNGRTS